MNLLRSKWRYLYSGSDIRSLDIGMSYFGLGDMNVMKFICIDDVEIYFVIFLKLEVEVSNMRLWYIY